MVQLLQLLDITPRELIPQQPPFVMIDGLTHCDESETATLFTVRADNIFVEDNEMLAAGLIENMAQTCAARFGYLKINSNKPPRIGVIGAINRFHIERMPKVGETIATTIKVKDEVFGMTSVEAECLIDNNIIATAELKIAINQ